MSVPPGPASVKVPSLGRRLILGALVFVGLFIGVVVVPVSLFQTLAGYGVASGLGLSTVELVGTGLAALGAVRYVLRPTRAYGPVAALFSTVTLLYLLYLSARAHLSVGFSGQGTFSLDYGMVLALLAIVPLFGLAAAIVTTVEDVARPGERLRVEYPAP